MSDRTGHVSLWHPWQDKPGRYHPLRLYNTLGPFESVESLIETVASNQYYTFVSDVMDSEEISFSESLLTHEKTTPYISKTGSVVALKLGHGKKSGYLIPGSIWGEKHTLGGKLLKNVHALFTLFGYEALTPASLSEKVLRATLPDYAGISRPSDMLRRTLLAHSYGGRIDRKELREFYPVVYEYDMNKAYLHMSRLVPSPFSAPIGFYHGNNTRNRFRWHDFAASFTHCNLTVHGTGIHPIQIKDANGDMDSPVEGENIDRWLWDRELRDCLEKGYTLEHVYEGYGWYEMSTFLQEWSDILWEKYTEVRDEPIAEIIKTMMVGLPGRFLKSPESYTLIHERDVQKDDMPIILKYWQEGKQITTPWFIRAEYNLQSAQLTPIGSYIVMACRQALYKAQLEEHRKGNQLIRSYIDCYSVVLPTTQPDSIGIERGQWKEKIVENVYVEENRMIPANITEMKAPGVTGKERQKLHETYFQSGETTAN